MRVMPRIASSHRWTIAVVALALAASLGMSAAPSSAGPIGCQASGGWYTNSEDFFLGAGARFGLGTITIIPNAEWLFVNDETVYSLNLDGTLSVLPLGVANVYVGAGLGVFTADPKQGGSHSDSVVNLIAGAGFNAVPLKPFAQFKWVMVTGEDPLVFSAGVRF